MMRAGFFYAMTQSRSYRPLSYRQCLSQMYGLRRFGIKLGLETIQAMLDGLGSPHRGFQAIHIAGTNGKGSVAAYLSAIIQSAGYATGLYTSPHLTRFNERIRVNGQDIQDEDVVNAYQAAAQSADTAREPTFFELTTAMAFYIFAQKGVQWAIIETGMGGRLDATNVIMPAISVITNISREHQQYLGNDIAQIAYEKAGIIKPDTPVVIGAMAAPANAVIQDVAQSCHAPLYRSGIDFHARRHADGGFDYIGINNQWRHLNLNLIGEHQFHNAGLALAACDVLVSRGLNVNQTAVADGLRHTRWPGRLEQISSQPPVLLDGAHNLAAAQVLRAYLRAHLSHRSLILVIGILDDKPYLKILDTLLPLASRVIITQAQIDRAVPAEKLGRQARMRHACVDIFPRVADAVAHALEIAGAQDVICIAGSLYVVGEARAMLASGPEQAGHAIQP